MSDSEPKADGWRRKLKLAAAILILGIVMTVFFSGIGIFAYRMLMA